MRIGIGATVDLSSGFSWDPNAQDIALANLPPIGSTGPTGSLEQVITSQWGAPAQAQVNSAINAPSQTTMLIVAGLAAGLFLIMAIKR